MKINYRGTAFVAIGMSVALAVSPGRAFAQAAFNAQGSTLGGTSSASTLGSSGSSSSGGLGSSLGGGTSSGSGGGGRGNTGGGGGSSTTTSTPAVPTTSNIFSSTFANPQSQGLASNYYPNSGTFGAPNTTTPSFGKAIYTQTTTTSSSTTQATTTLPGFSTVGQSRSPVYATVLRGDLPMVEHSATDLQAKVQAAIARSSYLNNKQNIQVAVDGATVLLRGQVMTEREYRAAEYLARTETGVRDVLNDLQIVGPR